MHEGERESDGGGALSCFAALWKTDDGAYELTEALRQWAALNVYIITDVCRERDWEGRQAAATRSLSEF